MVDCGELSSKNLACEVLVIGSGAGGATVGNELVKAGFDVLILEEGVSAPAENAPATLSESFMKIWRLGGMTLAKGSTLVRVSALVVVPK